MADSELFTIDTGQLIGANQAMTSGTNEATRDLCRAYIWSGVRLLAKRNIELAVEHLEEAVHLARQNDDRLGKAAGLGCLGNAYHCWEDMEQALSCYESALRIARETGGSKGQGYILFNMSLTLSAMQDRAQAIECAGAALEILAQIDDPGVALVRAKLERWQGETSYAS